MGRAARHTLVLKEELEALIRPALPGLRPQIVVDTTHSEAADIYEQGKAASKPMDVPSIWNKPTGRAYLARTGRGTWELTAYSFLLTVDKRRQEAGERDALNCFSGLLFF